MEQYLIDTNIVSNYLSASFNTNGMEFMDKVINSIPVLSVITQIELLCWQTDKKIENNIKEFISDSKVLNIDADIIAECVHIRRNKKIKTPDAIIAATAITYNYTLISNNEKDFSNIKSLKVVNPHTL